MSKINLPFIFHSPFSILHSSLIILFAFIFTYSAHAQSKPPTDSLALPDFLFYTLKDSTPFTPDSLQANKPIVFIYFKTDCPYCHATSLNIVNGFDSLKSYQIVMVSNHTTQQITDYIAETGLDKLPITILRDRDNNMHLYYRFDYIPLICLYNRHHRRIYRKEGKITVKSILYRFGQGED